jgi:hypothetical protein
LSCVLFSCRFPHIIIFAKSPVNFFPPFLPGIAAIEAYSDEFFEWWQSERVAVSLSGDSIPLGGNLSFCYIDGNHSYEQSKRDFENCDRFVEIGGFILLDDSADISGSPGVQVLIKELISSQIIGGRYRLVMKNPNYLICKIAQ